MSFLVLGFQIAVSIIGGILGGMGLGYLADKYFNTRPFGIILGIIIGVFMGGAAILRTIKNK